MTQKDGSIVLSDWQKGVAESPIVGNDLIVGCDIFDEVGILKLNSKSVATTDLYINTIVDAGLDGVPVADVVTEAGRRYIMTSDGYIFEETSGSESVVTTPVTKGWDLCVWSDDFIVASYVESGQGRIGVISTKTGSSVWHANKVAGTFTTAFPTKMIKGQDGTIYFTNSRYIGQITAISESAGTVTVTSSDNVLDLPADVHATTIVELGSNLLIGTQKGSSYADRINHNFANIYLWDRVSTSFRFPVQVNENGIHAMVQKNNQVYFSAGTRGNIYVTDGANFQKVTQIPYCKLRKDGPTSQVYYNAMSFNQQGNLLIGLSSTGGLSTNTYMRLGVWEIGLSSGFPCHLAYTAPSGEIGQSQQVEIGYVWATSGSTIYFGVRTNGNTPDVLETQSILNSGYNSYYESPKILVGTRTSRKSYQKIEFTLAEQLVSGQSLRVKYRKNGESSYTTIGEWSYDDLGAVISHVDKALIADAELLQFRVELDQDEATAFPNNLKIIRIVIS